MDPNCTDPDLVHDGAAHRVLALAAPFAVRALPALLYRAQLGMRHTMAPGFRQAIS